jgi:hypothetical protein
MNPCFHAFCCAWKRTELNVVPPRRLGLASVARPFAAATSRHACTRPIGTERRAGKAGHMRVRIIVPLDIGRGRPPLLLPRDRVAAPVRNKSIFSPDDEAPDSTFFHPDVRFCLDVSFHPSCKSISSSVFWDAFGEFGGNKSVGNVEKSSRAPGGPDLSARKADRRPHRIVFRTLCKSLPPDA